MEATYKNNDNITLVCLPAVSPAVVRNRATANTLIESFIFWLYYISYINESFLYSVSYVCLIKEET